MWTRAELKTRAKEILKIVYWKALLVSFILAILSGGGSSGRGRGFNFNFNSRNGISINNLQSFNNLRSINYFGSINVVEEFFRDFSSYIIPIAIVVSIAIAGAIFFKLFVMDPILVGGRKFFLKAAEEKEGKLDLLAYAFTGRKYLAIVKTMFFKGLFIFLWSLLLVIPGIIKAYAYRMVPYILSENPNIGHKRALELSEQMTAGHKFNIFALDISFIGWYILGLLLFGFGIFLVHPYVNATDAELYLELRRNALEEGYCTPGELGME